MHQQQLAAGYQCGQQLLLHKVNVDSYPAKNAFVTSPCSQGSNVSLFRNSACQFC